MASTDKQKRLTHSQIRQVCAAEDRKDFVTCPKCGGHLHLFDRDGFACVGNSSHSPCKPEDVAAKLRGMLGGTDTAEQSTEKVKKPKPSELLGWKGFSLRDYCNLKRLDIHLLEHLFGASTATWSGNPVAAWNYYDENGKKLASKLRLSSDSHDTRFDPADPHVPYGLNNPLLKNLAARAYDLIIAEGESDAHTFAAWGFIVIGISGSQGWLPEYAELPVVDRAGRIFIAEHADEGGKIFAAKVLRTLPQAFILRPPEGIKDFNELHLKHVDFKDSGSAHPFIQSIDIGIQAATLEKAMRKPKPTRPKPLPMRDEAFYGLAGKVVALLEPVLETDRASILSNFLGCAGVLFQHDAHFKVIADLHYPVDYFLTVGNSAISRKGTTTNAVLEVLERVQPGFKERIIRGLSTGQGLITALKSPNESEEEEQDNIQHEPIAPSVLVEISEFAELLAVMKREENTLSAVMRDAWDGKPLAVLTRNQPLRVKNISLATIAHITRTELLNKLTSTDRANGFANRFLFVWTERTKLLPKGDMSHLNYNEVVAELHSAIQVSSIADALERDEEADRLWAEEYKRLSTRGDTMTDALLSRAEAHVIRLSLLYALLDGSPEIRKVHLRAALAVWDYCEESVRFVFGDAADPDNAKILRKLEDDPLTTGEIRRFVFGDNKSAEWVAEKMVALEQLRKVRRGPKLMKTKTVEAWHLVEFQP